MESKPELNSQLLDDFKRNPAIFVTSRLIDANSAIMEAATILKRMEPILEEVRKIDLHSAGLIRRNIEYLGYSKKQLNSVIERFFKACMDKDI